MAITEKWNLKTAYVKELLEAQGRTQTELAAYLGTHKSHLGRWLQNAVGCRFEYLFAMAEFLNTRIEDLVEPRFTIAEESEPIPVIGKIDSRYDPFKFPDSLPFRSNSVLGTVPRMGIKDKNAFAVVAIDEGLEPMFPRYSRFIVSPERAFKERQLCFVQDTVGMNYVRILESSDKGFILKAINQDAKTILLLPEDINMHPIFGKIIFPCIGYFAEESMFKKSKRFSNLKPIPKGDLSQSEEDNA